MGAGAEIKRLRELSGKSAAVVASLIGVDAERMRKWERNNVDPNDSEDIRKVELYFGKTLNELGTLETFQFVKKEKPPETDDFKERYYRQIEKNNDLLTKQVEVLTGLVKKVEESLVSALENQAGMAAMNEAFQERFVDILAKLADYDAGLLLETVHRTAVEKMKVYTQRGNRLEIGT